MWTSSEETRDVIHELKKRFPGIPALINSILPLPCSHFFPTLNLIQHFLNAQKMRMGSTALFVLQLALVIGLTCGQQQVRRKDPVPEVDQKCLECICQASTDCDTKAKCHNAGADSYFCGPYLISWGYWHESGRPGDRGKAHDFETCLNDKACAERSIKGYMKKHGQDCDRDGAISCYDFSRIHKLGPGNCGADMGNSAYWEKFLACYEGRSQGQPSELGDGFYDYSG